MKTIGYPKPTKKKRRINLLSKPETRSQLIKKLDKLVSNIVRERAEWKCERCFKQYEPPTQGLHCSHFFSRRFIGTRFDLDNLIALCYGCHRLVESDKVEGSWYHNETIKRIGRPRFELLRVKAYSPDNKWNKEDLKLLLQTFEEQV